MTARIVLLLTLAAAAPAADWDFDDTVAAFERHYRIHRVKIPMFGLAQFAGSMAVRPFGVKDFQMAIFENVDTRGYARFEFAKSQPGWRSIIRVTERGGDTVSIFARDEDNWLRMFVVTLENGGDAVLLEFKLRPTRLMEFVAARARTD
jgi:hypothetical protein